jgi:hypothetical protein
MNEIEKLENRNRILDVQISHLNINNITKNEQEIIDSHLNEIAINEIEIRKIQENNSK